MLVLAAILTIVILSVVVFKSASRKHNFPPGPFCFPIIGTLHITRDAPHLACRQLAKKYGPILSIKFASEWNVVLHDAKHIREAFNDFVFAGRTPTKAGACLVGDEQGILQASGNVWMEHRRFAMRTLRDFGFGKASMEEMIMDEAQELVDWMKKQAGQPVELKRRFSLAVVNSLWRILTGERYDHDDPALLDILEKLERAQHVLFACTSPLKMAIIFFYPLVAQLFPKWSGWQRLVECAQSKTKLFDRIITEHIETFQPEGPPRDFIDVYLQEFYQTTNATSALERPPLRSIIADLFFAGADTTSVTLQWTILYLLHNPEVQHKIRKELDFVVGTSRQPSLSDRKSLPYLESVIMEVMRCSSILPIGVAHTTVQDVRIGGYDIPKGTMVNPNVFHIHHDPTIWADPEVFRPERFLNSDGSCMGRHEGLMPFSIGRRSCLGENLARETLFIFTAMIVQNFTVGLPEFTEMPPLAATTGQLTLQPKKFVVSLNSTS